MTMTQREMAELRELRARLAALEAELARDRPTRSASAAMPHLSRRSLLRTLTGVGAGAALGAVAVATTGAAGAAQGDNVRAGLTTTATGPTKVVRGSGSSTSEGTFAAVWGDQAQEVGVVGSTTESIGVMGISSNATGVFGRGGFTGVLGEAAFLNPVTVGVRGRAGIGVLGDGSIEHAAAPIGVEGRSANSGGIGVKGTNGSNVGVLGDGAIGVRGVSGASQGVGVEGSTSHSTAIGVSGSNVNNVGVQGFGRTGVQGTSLNGVGGQFTGGRAAIRLEPRSSVGRPTGGIHQRGELVIDALGALFVCTANGAPGTWRKVTTTVA